MTELEDRDLSNKDPIFSNNLDSKILNDSPKNQRKCSRTLVIFIIITSSIILLSCFIVFFLHFTVTFNTNYSIVKLNNWEFGSSENISLTGEQISNGEISKDFFKAPREFNVCTAMGGLSGNDNNFYYETNLKNINKTQFDVPWFFKSQFTIKDFDKNKNLILLHINGINYKSDIYIDGKKIANETEIIGTFVKFTIDITQYLNTNNNTHNIVFKINRPHNQWGGSYTDTDLAISFVDWNPEAPDSNMGIWQPVEIETIPIKTLTIMQSFVITKLNDNNTIADLSVIIHIKNWENSKITKKINVKIGNFTDLNIENIEINPYEEKQIELNSANYSSLIINNPKLWYPYQMGNPTLHDLKITIYNDDFNYIYKKKIGLREVKSELSKDGKIRVYIINNKKLLLKGAGWTPDLFLRQSKKTYKKHINYVRHMELNVIRLEGKSEGEEFYDYCDEKGILIIQGWNCADAWQKWKYWSEEVHEIGKKSMRNQIRKLSIHPSVIIFIQGSDLHPTEDVEKEWNIIFEEEKWPNEILSSATNSKSEISGDTGVKMSGPYSWVPPHYFYFDKNEEYGGAWGFLTEGGPGENPLRNGSYQKVFDDVNITYPLGESWNYHCGNKGVFGNLGKLIEPINNRYGEIKDFKDFEKKSSILVYDSHRAMFEAYTYNKYHSTGVIQWMLNNAWPSNIWHLYDYFFAVTPSYFATKKAGEKIHVMFSYNDTAIYILNNYFDDMNNDINVNLFVFSGNDGKNILYNQNYIQNGTKGDEVIKITQLNYSEINEDCFIIHLEYSYENNFNTNTYFVNKQMDEMDYANSTFYNVGILKYADLKCLQNIALGEIKIEVIEKKEVIKDRHGEKYYNKLKVSNIGDNMLLLLELRLYDRNDSVINPVYWSDNYFSLRKGTYMNVTFEYYLEDSSEKNPYVEVSGWNLNNKYYLR